MVRSLGLQRFWHKLFGHPKSVVSLKLATIATAKFATFYCAECNGTFVKRIAP